MAAIAFSLATMAAAITYFSRVFADIPKQSEVQLEEADAQHFDQRVVPLWTSSPSTTSSHSIQSNRDDAFAVLPPPFTRAFAVVLTPTTLSMYHTFHHLRQVDRCLHGPHSLVSGAKIALPLGLLCWLSGNPTLHNFTDTPHWGDGHGSHSKRDARRHLLEPFENTPLGEAAEVAMLETLLQTRPAVWHKQGDASLAD
eukprot:6214812-Amphidinium_carterae.1